MFEGTVSADWTDKSKGMTHHVVAITCPHCGRSVEETMPTDRCVHFYECRNCRIMLRPKPGDWCVFRSHGNTRRPPMQAVGAHF